MCTNFSHVYSYNQHPISQTRQSSITIFSHVSFKVWCGNPFERYSGDPSLSPPPINLPNPPPPSAWQTGFADKILLRKRQHCWDFVYIKTHFRFIPPYNSVPFDPSLYYQRWALIPWSNYVTLPYIIPSISLFQALGWIDLVIFESFKNGYIKVK